MSEEAILNLCSIIIGGVMAMTFLLSVVLPNILEAIAEYKTTIKRLKK